MKALVLASGGVDSTTCLGLAVNKYGKENVIALTVAHRFQPMCRSGTDYFFPRQQVLRCQKTAV